MVLVTLFPFLIADSLISSKSAESNSAPKTEHILVFDSAGGASGMEIPSSTRPASLPLRTPVQSSKQPVKALLQRQKSSERLHKGGASLTPTPSSNATPIPPSRRSSGSRRSRTPERRRSPRTPDRSTTASFSASSTATLTAMQNVRRRSRTPDASHKTARPVSVAGTGDAVVPPAPMSRNDPLRHSFGRGGTASSNIENFSNKNNMLSHITKKRHNNKRQPSPLRGTNNLNATYPQIQYINSTNSSGGRKKGIVLDGGDRNNYEEDDC